MMYDQLPRALDILYDWSPEKMVEVELDKPDDFLKIRETLTRIGIVNHWKDSEGRHILTQTCHLLHKKGRYYVVHFKEMFALDGRGHDLTVSDVERRNLIVSLLEDWGLAKIISKNAVRVKAPMSSIRVISHKEKKNFILQAKYQVGSKR